jgi:hypothetical protein
MFSFSPPQICLGHLAAVKLRTWLWLKKYVFCLVVHDGQVDECWTPQLLLVLPLSRDLLLLLLLFWQLILLQLALDAACNIRLRGSCKRLPIMICYPASTASDRHIKELLYVTTQQTCYLDFNQHQKGSAAALFTNIGKFGTELIIPVFQAAAGATGITYYSSQSMLLQQLLSDRVCQPWCCSKHSESSMSSTMINYFCTVISVDPDVQVEGGGS